MKRNLMPFDLANVPNSEEAIEHYLRQLMEEGGAAKVARARLQIEKAQARTSARANAVIATPAPAPPYPLPVASISTAAPSPLPDNKASPRRCCG
ncbi:hypothetical protein [Pseudomonas sp. NPDC089401]|uniref:hypothetical protein n=1 Tax=Pseudomonas sp. NPDC089401 TaxID=3364462 RepID=UPI00381EF3DB